MVATTNAVGLLLLDQGLERFGGTSNDLGCNGVAHHDHAWAAAEHIGQFLEHGLALLRAPLDRHVVHHDLAIDRLSVRVPLGGGDRVDQLPQIVDVHIIDREERAMPLKIWGRGHGPNATTMGCD